MIADLRTLPFSRKGSWMVLSELNENWNGCGNEAGLYLRTVHSSAMTPLVARVIPETQGKPAEYSAEINRAALMLKSGEDRIECCFDDPETILIRGTAGIRLTLDFLSGTGPIHGRPACSWPCAMSIF